MSRKYREDRDIFEIYHPEALIFTFFSLFGPLVAMFDIFYNIFFREMIPFIIKCNPWKFEANRLRFKKWGNFVKTPCRRGKRDKTCKINLFWYIYILINLYKPIFTPYGYVTFLPLGGDGAKVVIAFKRFPFGGRNPS